MKRDLTANISLFVLWMTSLFLNSGILGAQTSDTVKLDSSQYIILKDTLIFGIHDSIVVLPAGANYRIRETKKGTVNLFHYTYTSLMRPNTALNESRQKDEFENHRNYFIPYEGKTIRKIDFRQVDILEGNVTDTLLSARTNFAKWLNKNHIPTRIRVLKSNLRFEVHEKLNPSILAENERLLRRLSYIEDAKIFVNPHDIFHDSVDILIVTQDKFPIGISGDINDYNHFNLELFTRNFLGMGHGLAGNIEYNGKADQATGYGARYSIENIAGAFTTGQLEFENTDRRDLYRLNLKKPFITNDMVYGGEIDIFHLKSEKDQREYYSDSTAVISLPFTSNNYDFWLGRSFFFDKTYNRYLNAGLRIFSEKFTESPDASLDSNIIFHNKIHYLFNFTFRNSRYFTTTKLLNFGITEDIGVGYSLQFTGGLRDNGYTCDPYYEISGGWAIPYTKFGYMISFISYGGFYSSREWEDVSLGIRQIYFSPLISLNPLELRNICTTTFSSISNPYYLNPEDFGERIRNLNQSDIYGYSTAVISYESYFYTPYSLMGFKLAFSLFADSGWITQNNYFKGKKDFYGVYGIGLHIKNESLIIPAFTTEIGFLPNPVGANNLFEISLTFTDRSLLNPMSSMKPEIYYIR